MAAVNLPAPSGPIVIPSEPAAAILLVESNDSLRTVMANLLKKRGYRVVAAIDPQEALRIIDAQGPPDLLISQPAPELVRNLVDLQPHLRVLYLTGFSSESQTHGLAPWLAVLRRPFEPDTLLTIVQELLSNPCSCFNPCNHRKRSPSNPCTPYEPCG